MGTGVALLLFAAASLLVGAMLAVVAAAPGMTTDAAVICAESRIGTLSHLWALITWEWPANHWVFRSRPIGT